MRYPEEPECCICAALRMPDGYVVRGHRHDQCLATAGQLRAHADGLGLGLLKYTADEVRAGTQGFVTSRNRFVDRREGAALQAAAGVKSVRTGALPHRLLFSEDLY